MAKPAARPPVSAEAPPTDTQGAWKKVVAEITGQQAIRSAWLERAQEVSEENGVLRAVFPSDQAKLIKTPVVKEQGALIQELWKKLTGRKVVFQPEATGEVTVETPRAGAAAPIADDFENDPGIEAAIELFGATLEPEEAQKS